MNSSLGNKAILYVILIIFLSACIGVPYAGEVMVDGAATAYVFTWEDTNGNGVRDEGEVPMPFVTTSVVYPDYLTKSDGWGYPWLFKPGCEKNCWEGEAVEVKVPPGYDPTTPIKYPLTGDDNEYYFGFRISDRSRSNSFPNEPEWQKAFINRGAKIIAFHFSDDGQLEITLDIRSTADDEYYPEDYVTNKRYISIYVFDILLLLDGSEEIEIPTVQITLMPSGDIFTCKTEDIDAWDGRISGYEILTEHCVKEPG